LFRTKDVPSELQEPIGPEISDIKAELARRFDGEKILGFPPPATADDEVRRRHAISEKFPRTFAVFGRRGAGSRGSRELAAYQKKT
jgi:hypothetical protein